MMDITKSREDFEAYIRKNFQYPTLEMEPEDGPCAGEYVDTMREEQFQLWDAAWKASRVSIELELPTQDEYDDPLSAYNAISDCKKILRDAGIRIKGESE
ncbi:hypothetical protein [Yersinia pekkanenii]|uniref:Uncharacterized protein n=1 Tax=Yersinia pekkanenii TaxID=1288385 RepID=A0A0T9RLA2_9GAMM|nr:hypothetical protein [Yersinia pekkanenii]CNI69874.1 Uncharacterised protein [Yersinia pekkanenii]CRY69658.1 Uncharacterised protein [Yersinia pekkanenii]